MQSNKNDDKSEGQKVDAKHEALAALDEAEQALAEGNHDGMSQAIKKARDALK